MSEKILRDLFIGLQAQMVAKLNTNRSGISHPGAKGDASELNWIQWLKEYLPKRYCVDKAFVIDCEDNLSHQMDVVIYDRQYTPFAFKQDSVIYIPAESVYAVFEVKQELNKGYIDYAGEKFESVRALKRTSVPIPHAGGIFPAKSFNNIISGILTLSSSWAEPLGKSFEDNIISLPDVKRIDLGCVLQSGSFRIDYNKKPALIEKSTKEESLMFFFLKLLADLQLVGTIPAMDINSYINALDSIDTP